MPQNSKQDLHVKSKDFDPLDHIHRREARRMDLYSQYAVVSSNQALDDAGISWRRAQI